MHRLNPDGSIDNLSDMGLDATGDRGDIASISDAEALHASALTYVNLQSNVSLASGDPFSDGTNAAIGTMPSVADDDNKRRPLTQATIKKLNKIIQDRLKKKEKENRKSLKKIIELHNNSIRNSKIEIKKAKKLLKNKINPKSLTEQLRDIMRREDIADAYMLGDDIVFETEDLHVKIKRKRKIGRFIIRVNQSLSGVILYNKTYSYEEYDLPTVKNNICCFGNIEGDIKKDLKDINLIEFIDDMILFIKSSNDDNAYIKFKEWFKKRKKRKEINVPAIWEDLIATNVGARRASIDPVGRYGINVYTGTNYGTPSSNHLMQLIEGATPTSTQISHTETQYERIMGNEHTRFQEIVGRDTFRELFSLLTMLGKEYFAAFLLDHRNDFPIRAATFETIYFRMTAVEISFQETGLLIPHNMFISTSNPNHFANILNRVLDHTSMMSRRYGA